MADTSTVTKSQEGNQSKILVDILDPTSTAPLNVTKYTDFVRSPTCGAIAAFEGTTRDTFDGNEVLELQYEAYAPMAIRRLQSICSAAIASIEIHKVAVAHRLGTVPVGEASVFVAVSAVHRAEALEACRYVIDELKKEVPIWKKEVYRNGEVWKENREFLERKDVKKGGCCGNKVRVEDSVG